jgi:hypothetical protein
VVEADLRAGVAGLEAFGAVGLHARAQEDLGRWLVTQGRSDEAERVIASARETYSSIGAFGWLARRDAWQGADVEART